MGMLLHRERNKANVTTSSDLNKSVEVETPSVKEVKPNKPSKRLGRKKTEE